MSIAPAADIVHLWDDAGVPTRLVWAGRRYRILTADPVRDPAYDAALTHPVARLAGWAVVAAAEANLAEVCALQLQRGAGGTGWLLVDVDPG
ncbi:hypothetical protein IT072_16725 [Leifsonia sp. ZF2019]|uniref:hypothetical protein n=1 Tax=Leifsonia sp. ZF2019 TaxID=2781978 RepID=UPI001CC05302|nr:hypothetical protein [Leifsonia sp. ZF2019]UAJ78851.1 hypothetical protein IT072_16725 [Leifsonia sp. ZF2019]